MKSTWHLDAATRTSTFLRWAAYRTVYKEININPTDKVFEYTALAQRMCNTPSYNMFDRLGCP